MPTPHKGITIKNQNSLETPVDIIWCYEKLDFVLEYVFELFNNQSAWEKVTLTNFPFSRFIQLYIEYMLRYWNLFAEFISWVTDTQWPIQILQR